MFIPLRKQNFLCLSAIGVLIIMEENYLTHKELELVGKAIGNILDEPVETIRLSDTIPIINDVKDSNEVFMGKLSILFVDMRRSVDLADEMN